MGHIEEVTIYDAVRDIGGDQLCVHLQADAGLANPGRSPMNTTSSAILTTCHFDPSERDRV